MGIRRRPTTLALLATIEAMGLEAEYVAARREHPLRSTRWIAAKVIAEAAAKDAPERVVDLTQIEHQRESHPPRP
jgi:hypothetical protein